ncbi:uncharacterized protein LOC100908769, partial [Galendromus occidentalis]|uniref:Uncharacterized protein LOC100908769 n=1 Tax=Galendromus occidentalis TaxID=34638 RepID=A0AAJ7L7N4_9ACAR
MPREKPSTRSRLGTYVKLFGEEILSSDGQVLFCKVCEREVSADKKFLVMQHVNGVRHKSSLNKKKEQSNSSSVPQIIPYLEASGKKSQFNLDLCDAFLSAGIPLYKLDNQKLRALFENYVHGKFIWLSVDETTDATGRFVAHVVVGTLEAQASKSFLLHAENLEATNSTTISQVFMNSLRLLWPEQVEHDKVLLFVSDGAAYMKKAGKALKVLFPRMLHLTCTAHAVHRVAEEIRLVFPDVDKLVAHGKKVFLKSASRVTKFREMVPN